MRTLTTLCGVALDPGAGRRGSDLIGAGHTHVVPGHGFEIVDFILERRNGYAVCAGGVSQLGAELSNLEHVTDVNNHHYSQMKLLYKMCCRDFTSSV